MNPTDETGPPSVTPRPELAALIGTLVPENPKSFTNAMDLAYAIGTEPSEFPWLLVNLFPQLERSKLFWKDENSVEAFISKVPKDEGILKAVVIALQANPQITDRTFLVLGRTVCAVEALSSPMLAATLSDRLERSTLHEGPAIALQLSRFLDEGAAYALLVRHLGSSTTIDPRLGTGASNIGEHSAKLLVQRGYCAGLYLLQHFDEIEAKAGRVQAIGILGELGVDEAREKLCYLVQDTTFGSIVAEVVLSETILAPILRSASDTGAINELGEILNSRQEWKVAPDEPVTTQANLPVFVSKLQQRSFLNKLGAVIVSADFFYSFVRLFFSLKILGALRYLVSDSDRDIRVACAIALGKLKGPAPLQLKEALFDHASEVRDAALDSLRTHLSDAEIEAFLAEHKAKHEELKREAQDAKKEFKNIKIDNAFINSVISLAFSTRDTLSSAAGSLYGRVKSVFGWEAQEPEENDK